jgi:hypothetical protein
LERLGINNFKILDKKDNSDYLKNLDEFDIIFKTP